MSIAPFSVIIINLLVSDSSVSEFALNVYNFLKDNSIDVLYDDRDISAGEKFNDAYLLGIPYLLIIGKNFKDGRVELEERKTGKKISLQKGDYSKIVGIVER